MISRITRTEYELIEMEMKNLGRWCEVTLEATGEVVEVIRTGRGPMGYPEHDSHEVKIDGQIVAEFDNLYGVAEWLCNRR